MTELMIQRVVCARIPTDYGEFQLCLYTNNRDEKEHLALVRGNVTGRAGVLVRVHSECFTGDVLGSQRCDCGEQLQNAMKQIAAEGLGVVIYLRQEGRGIGLQSKLRAYNLQDEGLDTVDANLVLGHPADQRDYTIAALILNDLGIRSIRLLTNNPDKIQYLKRLGVKVVERVPSQPTVTRDNAQYLLTKRERMHHMLNLPEMAFLRANLASKAKHAGD
ncbi:MAG TPA: GTP cyclohydrolase II [Anaerolineaceae bacterium]|nr:GTP cyclohydrolase II [Anaerolineaceae bacterium]